MSKRQLLILLGIGALLGTLANCSRDDENARPTGAKTVSRGYSSNPEPVGGSSSGTAEAISIQRVEQGYQDASGNLKSVNFTVDANRVLKLKLAPVNFLERQPLGSVSDTLNLSSKMIVYLYLGDSISAAQKIGPFSVEQPAVVDLSDRFVRTCPDSDLSCKQSIRITLFKPNSDYYCLRHILFGSGEYSCDLNGGMFRVYSCSDTAISPKPEFCQPASLTRLDGHPWGVNILIETDFTKPLGE